MSWLLSYLFSCSLMKSSFFDELQRTYVSVIPKCKYIILYQKDNLRFLKCTQLLNSFVLLLGMDGNMVLNEIQRLKYKHCYRKQRPHSSSSDSLCSFPPRPNFDFTEELPELIPISQPKTFQEFHVDQVLQVRINNFTWLEYCKKK